MNIQVYQELIQDLIIQGIKVQDLTLLQIRYSINLYKKYAVIQGGSNNVKHNN